MHRKLTLALLFMALLAVGGIWYVSRDGGRARERARELYDEGRELFEKGDCEGAIEPLRRSINLDKGRYPEPIALLGMCYYENGQFKMAKEQFEKVLELNPGDDRSRVVYAACLLRTIQDSDEAWRRANAELDMLSESGRQHPMVLYNLACLYAENDRLDLALRYLSYAIKADASWREAAKRDSSFDSIRHTEQFNRLVR
jgi:tetratricopeptide (TPR) repeat protein